MRITKGVIAAAGKGTRFLPATKAVPKELLPVVDKPIIQYIVEEFVAAGIKDIAIVTAGDASIVAKHFQTNPDLEAHLQASGKTRLLREIRSITSMARITFLRQRGPYGNGTPCLVAKKFIGRQPFVYAFGDDLVLAPSSFTKQMCAAYRQQPGIYLGAQRVPTREAHKYGILEIGKDKRTNEVAGIVEKPARVHGQTALANIGRFILPPEIFPILSKKRLGAGSELWLVDAIQALIRSGHRAFYKKIERGEWYTTGDPINYLAAVRAYALARPDLQHRAKHIFK